MSSFPPSLGQHFIVSACLCGISCRYDGKTQTVPYLAELYKKGIALPVCPETAGGLPTPRIPCELINGRAITRDGVDVTDALLAGAEKILKLASEKSVRLAILKEKSPSCGSTTVYDGSFSGRIISGQGLTTALLRKRGILVINERVFRKMLRAGVDAGADFFDLFP